MWLVNFQCNHNLTLDNSLKVGDFQRHCLLHSFEPQPQIVQHTRWCLPSISHCSINSLDSCAKGQFDPVIADGKVYRNLYCVKCNLNYNEDLNCYHFHLLEGNVIYMIVMYINATLHTLGSQKGTIQMQITIGGDVILVNYSTVMIDNCSQVEVFDLVNFHCKPICPDGLVLQQGICVTMNLSDDESLPYPGYYEINLIGGSISIVSSLSILLTYALFKQLRNFHSLLLMNLTLAFLVNDSFIMVGVISSFIGESHGYCIANAICLHFFFLARFLWTNVLGIEYCRVFRLAFKVQNEGIKKDTCLYIHSIWTNWLGHTSHYSNCFCSIEFLQLNLFAMVLMKMAQRAIAGSMTTFMASLHS